MGDFIDVLEDDGPGDDSGPSSLTLDGLIGAGVFGWVFSSMAGVALGTVVASFGVDPVTAGAASAGFGIAATNVAVVVGARYAGVDL